MECLLVIINLVFTDQSSRSHVVVANRQMLYAGRVIMRKPTYHSQPKLYQLMVQAADLLKSHESSRSSSRSRLSSIASKRAEAVARARKDISGDAGGGAAVSRMSSNLAGYLPYLG